MDPDKLQPYEQKFCPTTKVSVHLSPRNALSRITHIMEDDRAATNLGPGVEDGISEEPIVAPKQPKRRFVGRKTADKGDQIVDPNANIEDTSAIQGVRRLEDFK